MDDQENIERTPLTPIEVDYVPTFSKKHLVELDEAFETSLEKAWEKHPDFVAIPTGNRAHAIGTAAGNIAKQIKADLERASPEDAPIWEARREGTRVWRVGEEVRDVER